MVVVVVDAIWLFLSNHTVTGVESMIAFLLPGFVWTSLTLIGLIPRYREVSAKFFTHKIQVTAHCFALLFIFGKAAGMLQYLTVTLNFPTVDTELDGMDRAIGFSWISVYYWVQSHALINSILHITYYSLFFQLLAIPWFLGLTGRGRYLREMLSTTMLSCLLTIAISAVFPAHSAYTYFHVEVEEKLLSVSHFDLLRNGIMRAIDIGATQGLVSMPSYHTILAILFTWSLRSCRPAFLLAIIWNFVMILSTPTEGGHYLVDVFGGIATAAITVAAIGWLSEPHRMRRFYGVPALFRQFVRGG